jgi:hypothetical protein
MIDPDTRLGAALRAAVPDPPVVLDPHALRARPGPASHRRAISVVVTAVAVAAIAIGGIGLARTLGPNGSRAGSAASRSASTPPRGPSTSQSSPSNGLVAVRGRLLLSGMAGGTPPPRGGVVRFIGPTRAVAQVDADGRFTASVAPGSYVIQGATSPRPITRHTNFWCQTYPSPYTVRVGQSAVIQVLCPEK